MITKIQPVLKKVIEETSPRSLVALSGPSIFAFYPNLNGKRVLLLGEVHGDINLCGQSKDYKVYPLDQWIYDLSYSTTDCLDLFVEDVYLTDI